MLVTGALLAVTAASSPSPAIVPASRHAFPGWIAGPLADLGPTVTRHTFWLIFLVMCAGYLAVLAGGAALPLRVAIGAIVVLHAVLLLAPPLLSRDVFNYIAYGHLFGLHGLDPYTHGAGFALGDPVTGYVCCRSSPDPYGPVFTLLASALSHLGLPTALWVFKSIAALSGLACVALVWRCARLLGRAPLAPALFVGLNPVGLVFGVGGGHNDWTAMLVVLGGMALFLDGRESRGVALVVAAAAVKISTGLAAPFMLLAARDRRRALAAALVVGALLAALLAGVFGTGAIGGLRHALSLQQHVFFLRDVPQQVAHLLGASPDAVKTVLVVAFVALVLWQLWRVAHGADWIAAAGWSTLGLVASSSWLLPWYVVWLLPLSALGASRRLRIAGLLATAYVIWARAPLVA